MGGKVLVPGLCSSSKRLTAGVWPADVAGVPMVLVARHGMLIFQAAHSDFDERRSNRPSLQRTRKLLPHSSGIELANRARGLPAIADMVLCETQHADLQYARSSPKRSSAYHADNCLAI